MRLSDPERSRAVLIGVGTYESPLLPPLPAVANNLADLAAVLTAPDLGGLRPDHCEVIRDRPDHLRVARTLDRHAAAAEDTLFVYYVGHGNVGPDDGQLYLSVADTDPNELHFSGLPYQLLHRLVARSPARSRIVVLDCCFSGRAILAGSLSGGLGGLIRIDGTYVFASGPANALSNAPVGQRYTTFTGELLSVLRSGLSGAPELLTVQTVYRHLESIAPARGMPQPERQSTGGVDDLGLVRNRAYVPPRPTASPVAPGAEPAPAAPPDLRLMTDALERHVLRVCAQRLRAVDDPAGLPVAVSTVDGVTVDPAAFHRRVGGARRTVLLGPPGSGKSVLAHRLCVELIRRGGRDEPVPVLVPAAAWDPRSTGVWPWVAAHLAEALGRTRAWAESLCAAGAVLPVLDGLDEIPQPLRATAIDHLNAGGVGALVLTCRTEDFPGGLRDADVVEAQPVAVEDVVPYVSGWAPRQWEAVTERLRAEPEGPLARVLRRPVWARAARERSTSRWSATASGDRDRFVPQDLLALTDPVAIEASLAPGLLAAAFPDGDDGTDRWDPVSARRWLAGLRRHTVRVAAGRPAGVVAWWELRLMARAMLGVSTAVLAVVTSVLINEGGLLARVLPGLVSGVILGALVGLPRSGLPPMPWHPTRSDAIVAAGALVVGVPASVLLDSSGGGARSFAASLVMWACYAFVIAAWAALWHRTGREFLHRGRLDTAVHLESPVSLLRADRSWVLAVVAFTAMWVGGSALVDAVTVGTHGSVGSIAAAVAVLVAAGCWWRFLPVRVFLALTGRMPWRLMAFLEDARDRGVLRRVGAAYEFRHDHLERPEPPPVPAVRTRPRVTVSDVLGTAGMLLGAAAIAFVVAVPIWDGRRNLNDTSSTGDLYRFEQEKWSAGDEAGMTSMRYPVRAGTPGGARFALHPPGPRYLHVQLRVRRALDNPCAEGSRVDYALDTERGRVHAGTFVLAVGVDPVHTLEHVRIGKVRSLRFSVEVTASTPGCTVEFVLQDPHLHSLPPWLRALTNDREG